METEMETERANVEFLLRCRILVGSTFLSQTSRTFLHMRRAFIDEPRNPPQLLNCKYN